MTEQELRDKLISVAPSAVYANESEIQAIVDLAKAYAEARQSKEIAELKAESKYWNERWEAGNKLQDAAFNSEIENYHEVKRLNAEIKRLRDALIWLKVNRTPDRAMIEVFIDKAISPAPVTEGPKEVSRETMMKALIDIEDDAHAKMVLGTPLNTKSILMSARHGLGIDSEMIHPLNEDQE